MFFSFDGIDGVGKTTQMELLAEWLTKQGHEVITCRDPGTTSLGESLRELLLDKPDLRIDGRAEMLMYMSARAQLVEEVILPALLDGKTVLSDRFLLANVAYQGHAGGVKVEEVWHVGYIATNRVLPDLTFLLDMDPSAARRRVKRPLDKIEQRGDDYRHRARLGFLAEASWNRDRIKVIDAARERDKVAGEIRGYVKTLLESMTQPETTSTVQP